MGAFLVALIVHTLYVHQRKSTVDRDDTPFDIGMSIMAPPARRVELLDGKIVEEVEEGVAGPARLAAPVHPADSVPMVISSRVATLVAGGASWRICAHEKQICPCRSGIVRYGSIGSEQWALSESEETVYPKCVYESFPVMSVNSTVKKICECLTPPGERPLVKEILPAIRTTTTPSPCADGRPTDFCGACRTPFRSREELCGPLPSNISHMDMGCRMLWSCDKSLSRRAGPSASEDVLNAQRIHDLASEEICKTSAIADQLDVYVECAFYDTWAKYTKDGVEWLEEAYITYVGGKSKYAGQITNLVRSVHMFSTKPIVVVVMGHEFVCPAEWRGMDQLVVYRMTLLFDAKLSFNFNKVRAIIASRVITGVELDSDQLIVAGMDRLFESTRKESNVDYPFPILPVHFASLDANPGESYANYRYKNYNKPHGMRWCHAHPSWTFWSLPWFSNILLINLIAWNTQKDHMTDWAWVKPFKLDNKAKEGLNMLENAFGPNSLELRSPKRAIWEPWMDRDETSMNVYLWKAGAYKQWCKFDLEPCLYFRGKIGLPEKLYSDNKWYPDGLPILFWSMHNTKAVIGTQKVLDLIEWCMSPSVQAWTNCTNVPQTWKTCSAARFVCDYFSDKKEEQGPWDFKPLRKDAANICCCLRPRGGSPYWWQGKWYAESSEVPKASRIGRHERKCLMP